MTRTLEKGLRHGSDLLDPERKMSRSATLSMGIRPE